MIKYTACFVGCVIGAIGEHTWLNISIEAENVDEAVDKLYYTHEHITRLFWLWPGKQTVCNHGSNDLARTQKGHQVYVSTYDGDSWYQTSCKVSEVSKVKADHMSRMKS